MEDRMVPDRRSLAFLSTNVISLIVASLALVVLVLACGGAKIPPPSKYVGSWTGEDGTLITIRGDGSGDYKTANSNVDNGSVTIDEAAKTLKIAFVGMGPTFNIDKPPSGDQMTLSGVVFKKGGSPTSSSDNKSSGDGPTQPPSTSEAEQLMTKTLADFAKGIEEGTLSDFYKNASAEWREQYTQEATDELFSSFLDGKNITPSLNDAASKKPKITDGPKIDTENGIKRLTMTGTYPSKPYGVDVTTEYYWSEGRWGWKRFKIDM